MSIVVSEVVVVDFDYLVANGKYIIIALTFSLKSKNFRRF